VPRQPFPPGAERSDGPRFRPDANGFVDTGYPCRLNRDTRTVTVTGPPPGVVRVGGYRFMLGDLQDLVERADGSGGLAALPDGLAGHRLAGFAANPDQVRAELIASGVNPLVADAFRDRRAPEAA
jgi:hypothetical protein